MQNLILRKKFYQIQKIDEAEYSTVVRERYEKLCLYDELRNSGTPEELALKAIKSSRATLYRWKNRYTKRGLVGLEDKSRRPRTVRSCCWTKYTERAVLGIRRKYKLYGKYKLAILLEKERGIKVSVSTVGRILGKLIALDRIKPASLYLMGTLPKRRRVFSDHAQRLHSGVRAQRAGELVQIDHMTIAGDKHPLKIFNAVCPVSKIMYSQVYLRATSTTAARFLEEVLEWFKITIHSIQVDGGSEFMGEFEQLCKEKYIPLYVLPPKKPELNGTVERGNGTIKYECCYQYSGPLKVVPLRAYLRKFIINYNTHRPHQALNYLTPYENYSQLLAEA